MNYQSFKVKLDFATYVEGRDGQEVIGEVHGKIYKISERANSMMIWMDASEIRIDDSQDNLTYTGNMKLIAYLPSDTEVKPGQVVTLSGNIKRPDVSSNPGGFDARSYYENQGVFLMVYSSKIENCSETYSMIATGLLGLKEKMEEAYDTLFDSRYASVVCAMLLGEKSGMDEELKCMYQINGMSHILAISGVHIAILGLGFFKLLKKLVGSFYLCGSVTMCIMILYGSMTGMSGSTARAIIMIGMYLIGQALGRTVDLLTSMGFSCILMTLFNPYIIRDAGFQLSFMAIAGLGIINPVLLKVFGEGGKFRQTLYAGISVNLALVPVIIYYYYELPLYSVLLNLVVIPLVSVVIFFSLITGIVGMLSLPLAHFFALPVTWILKLYDVLGDACTKLPYHSIHIGHISMNMIIVYYLLIAFALFTMLRLKEKRNRICCVTLLAVAFLSATCYEYTHLDREFLVVFLDVGQGDGILVRTDTGINIMIDGGSMNEEQVGKYVLTPALKYYAMSEVDYVLVSHGDKDHISGLVYLLQTEYTGITIHNIVLPLYGDGNAFEELINVAKEKNVNILYADSGLSMDMGDSKLTCLYPDANVHLTETNNLSGVWKLTTKNLSVLFPGDLDAEGEQYILRENIDISCDVLKVGHHGSKYSSSEAFLEACQMKQAVISSGEMYGHPHEETLERLVEAGVEIYRTDTQGAICIYERNEEIRTDTCFR